MTSHAAYQEQLLNQLSALYVHSPTLIEANADLLSKLYYLDLDPAYDVLAPLYSRQGRSARLQAEILRSLVAMIHCHEDSIKRWVNRLRSNHILPLACGFHPQAVPGVGTYYDFMHRLWSLFPPHRPGVRKRRPKPRKPEKGQKLQ